MTHDSGPQTEKTAPTRPLPAPRPKLLAPCAGLDARACGLLTGRGGNSGSRSPSPCAAYGTAYVERRHSQGPTAKTGREMPEVIEGALFLLR